MNLHRSFHLFTFCGHKTGATRCTITHEGRMYVNETEYECCKCQGTQWSGEINPYEGEAIHHPVPGWKIEGDIER